MSGRRRSGAPRPEPELGPQVGDERRRPPLPTPDAGRGLVRANLIGTAVFVAACVGEVVAPSGFTLVLVVVSLVWFVAGTVAFMAAYVIAIGRSRTEAIGMGGLFFLAGCAPRRTQVMMMAAWAIQIVVAFVVASLGVFTGAAFALLAPMFGIGIAGLWSARHGSFPPRVDPATPRRPPPPQQTGETS